MTTLELPPELVVELEADPTERRPGDFARHPHTGAPYVAHPTDTVKRAGLKADLLAEARRLGIDVPVGVTVKALQELLPALPKRVMYGRPSGLGKQIENATNLQKWAERMVALGIAVDPLLADEARRLVELDPESPEFRDAADRIASTAKKSAGATLAAERGTHHHELTEDFDQDRDPIARMAAGESLGVPRAVQQALLAAWDQMLGTTGLEVLATEVTVVDDEWRQAGTLDRIARLTRPLRFTTGEGEIVDLPAGTVIVLDLKTGRLRLTDNGQSLYWHTYAVQVASYAQSVPYDPDTDQRGEWPWEIDQRWGIIAHLDVRAALDGEAVCQLIAVDLEAGRHAGDLCVAAKSWEKRCGVFGLVADARIVVPTPSADDVPLDPSCRQCDLDRHICPGCGSSVPHGTIACAACSDPQPATTEPTHISVPLRRWVLDRLQALNKVPAAKKTMLEMWPAEIPRFITGHPHTDAELRQLAEVLDTVERAFELPFGASDPTVDRTTPAQPEPAPLPPLVDEGDRIDDADLGAVKATLDRLPAEQRHVLESWAKEANAAKVSFSIKQRPSQRRYSIYQALIAIAPLVDDDLDRVRATIAAVIPDAAMPAITLGSAIGALTIAEAERLREIAMTVRSDDPTHGLCIAYGDNGEVWWISKPNQNTSEQETNR